MIGWGLVGFLPSADQPQPQRPSSESENRSRNPDARCERLLRYWGDLGFGVDREAVGTHPHCTSRRPTWSLIILTITGSSKRTCRRNFLLQVRLNGRWSSSSSTPGDKNKNGKHPMLKTRTNDGRLFTNERRWSNLHNCRQAFSTISVEYFALAAVWAGGGARIA